MNTKKYSVLQPDLRNEKGAIFHTDLNVSHLFEFYYIKKHDYNNGLCRWDLCVALKGNTSDTNYIRLEPGFIGTEVEAKARLEEIVWKGFSK